MLKCLEHYLAAQTRLNQEPVRLEERGALDAGPAKELLFLGVMRTFFDCRSAEALLLKVDRSVVREVALRLRVGMKLHYASEQAKEMQRVVRENRAAPTTRMLS